MSRLHRRALLVAAAAWPLAGAAHAQQSDRRYANSEWRRLTDAQWRERLNSDFVYQVLRHEATERPYASPLNSEHRPGRFVCAGCDLDLFRSAWKFDSGTGWPSFWRTIEANVGTQADYRIGYERTEYHCARCLGHQGHVFNDGPRPTGLRYCNNGAALRFIPD